MERRASANFKEFVLYSRFCEKWYLIQTGERITKWRRDNK